MRYRRPVWAAGAAWAVVCLLVGVAPAAAQPVDSTDTTDAPAATGAASTEADIYCTPDDPGLLELSGLVVVGETIYAIGDSGADDQVAVMDSSCQVTEWIPNPVDPFDVEDLTYRDGRLWLADIGDNSAVRETIAMTDLNLSDSTGEVHRLSYPDGPRDAEAALLESDGRPVIITKDATGNSEVFTADTPVGDLPSPGPTPMRSLGPLVITSTGTEGGPPLIDGSLMVTGAALDASGTVAALRTYTDLYLFRVGDAGVGAALLEPPAVTMPLPAQPQGEAIAFLDNGDLLVASEGGTREATQPIAIVRGAAAMVAPQQSAESDTDGAAGPSSALVFALSATVLLIGAAVFLGRRSRRANGGVDDEPDSDAEPDEQPLGFDPDDPYALDLDDLDDADDQGASDTGKSSGRRGRR